MHHSGSTPNGILAAARDEATVMGVAIDVEPHEALLTCVRIAAGEVAYCSQKVQELAPDEAIGRLIELKSEPTVALTDAGIAETGEMGISEIKDKGPELHVWIRIRQGALDRLARFSKMAIDAGVEERRVALAERWGEDLAGVLRTILDGLQLNAKQRERAPGVVRDALEPLEGTGNLLLG